MFRIEFVSVINLHTKLNMTTRHVSLLKRVIQNENHIHISSDRHIVSVQREIKEEEEEEEKLLQWKRTIFTERLNQSKRKNPRLSAYRI